MDKPEQPSLPTCEICSNRNNHKTDSVNDWFYGHN